VTERPPLADGERWPEPERRGWQGRTERGRRLMRIARERLRDAEPWRPVDPEPDPWLNENP
jgi:hypothetical protein